MATGTGDERGATRARSLLALTTLLAVGGAGCESILGIEDIAPCWDPAGFEGRGCYREGGGCKLTKEQIPNACTTSPCIPFDNEARLGIATASDLPLLEGPLGSGGGGAGGSGGSGGGAGLPSCESLSGSRVLVVGSNAILPILSALGADLAANEAPIHALYQRMSSCDGAKAIVEDTLVSGVVQHWTRVGNEIVEDECILSAETPADIGTSDVFAGTCGLPEGKSGIVDAQGPIQAMIFVTPISSAERSISAEAARLVYGYGGTHQSFQADPWTDPSHILRRDPASGTQNLIGAFIGVHSTRFEGAALANTQAMIDSIKATPAGEASATIGILDVVNIDDERGSLRALAFQAKGQTCAFLPDADKDGADKRNVRDGHYTLWGPIHVFSRAGAGEETRALAEYLTLARAPGALDQQEANMKALLKIVADGSLVPQCAMQVRRLSDGGGLQPNVPERSCACYFDQIRTGANDCEPCTKQEDCQSADAPQCNYGFCERQ